MCGFTRQEANAAQGHGELPPRGLVSTGLLRGICSTRRTPKASAQLRRLLVVVENHTGWTVGVPAFPATVAVHSRAGGVSAPPGLNLQPDSLWATLGPKGTSLHGDGQS